MRKLAEEAFCVEYIRRIRQKDGHRRRQAGRMYLPRSAKNTAWGYNRFYDIIDKYGLKVAGGRQDTDSSHDLPCTPTWSGNSSRYAPTSCGWRHHLYGRLSQWPDGRIHLLLPFSCHRLLHQGDYRLGVGQTLETRFAVEALKMALGRLEGNRPRT